MFEPSTPTPHRKVAFQPPQVPKKGWQGDREDHILQSPAVVMIKKVVILTIFQ